MGQNFALNIASHGFKICVGNRSPAKVALTVDRAKAEGDLPLVGSKDVADLVSQLSKPRKVVILVMAGKVRSERTVGQLGRLDIVVANVQGMLHRVSNQDASSLSCQSRSIHCSRQSGGRWRGDWEVCASGCCCLWIQTIRPVGLTRGSFLMKFCSAT